MTELRSKLFELAKTRKEAKEKESAHIHQCLVAQYLNDRCFDAAARGDFTVKIDFCVLEDGWKITYEDVKRFAIENDLDLKKESYKTCRISFEN